MKLGLHDLKPTGNYLNRRYIFEMDFPDTSNPSEGYQYIDEVITAQHMRDFPQLYKGGKPKFYPQVIDYKGETEAPVIQNQPVPDNLKEAIAEINNCTTLEELKGYWLISKGNLTLAQEYRLKENLLKNAGDKK